MGALPLLMVALTPQTAELAGFVGLFPAAPIVAGVTAAVGGATGLGGIGLEIVALIGAGAPPARGDCDGDLKHAHK